MNEWTTLVKNAVSVLVILLAISVVLFLTYLGLNAANKGGEKLSNTTAAMDQRSFDQYNQTTISGTTVLSAIKNFQNQPVAVIVRTKSEDSLAESVNYDAYLSLTNTATSPTDAAGWKCQVTLTADNAKSKVSSTNCYLRTEYQNLDITTATQKSKIEYINPNAKFKSVLIYDVHDEVVGIYVEQLNSTTPIIQ